MTETATTRKTAEHQRAKLTAGLIPRNSVDGDCARVFQRIDWLPTPMQMPNEETGKRRRKGQILSSGRTASSDGCKTCT